MNPFKRVSFAILLLCLASICWSQTGLVTIESKPPGAAVYIDSMFVGKTPLLQKEARPGSHELRVIYPNATSWMALSKQQAIEVEPGKEVRYAFELGSILTLNSRPAGASVFLQDRELGMTPLYYRASNPLSGTLLLKKEGYEPTAVALAPEYAIPPRIDLKPLSNNGADKMPDVFPADYRNGSSPRWATYAAASTMIISGVLSAYWKNQANSDFDKYSTTKDPALLSSTQHFDNLSGITIAISHLSLALLAYLLLSE